MLKEKVEHSKVGEGQFKFRTERELRVNLYYLIDKLEMS
jgi:hypothetical protein